MMVLMSLALSLAGASAVWAGMFDDYTDYQNPDGTYSYYFDQGVLVTMDEDWYQSTFVKTDDRGATFFQKASYDAYAEEGMEGGRLFTIGASVNTSFKELPSFEYIGFDEENAMNYFAVLPTDYQAYMEDEDTRAEYDELWAGVRDVIAGIQIGYGTSGTDMQETEADFHPAIITSGDYSYMINDDKTATICEYTGDEDVIEIPSEIDGYPVSEIGYQAFTYKEMSSLTIPDSVRAIGQRAFEYCVISDTLQLPENITIGCDAFSYAELPSAVDIPAGTVVEDCAFSYCDTIKQVFIGSEAVIGSRAFDYCERLGQVVCGQGSRLNERAFEYCDVLGEVVLCGDVEADEESFSYCGDFEVIEAEADEYDTWAQPAEDDVKTGGLSGGWEVSEDEFLTVKARVLFEKAMADYDGAKCEPVTLLATQVVAGTNYCYLCRTDGDSETSPYQLVYIWEDLSGNAQVLEVQNIELGLSAE